MSHDDVTHAAGLTDDARRFVLQWHDVTDDTERKGGLPFGGPLFVCGRWLAIYYSE